MTEVRKTRDTQAVRKRTGGGEYFAGTRGRHRENACLTIADLRGYTPLYSSQPNAVPSLA